MHNEIHEINTTTFAKFISSKQICVIRAKTDVGLEFNKFIKTKLEQEFKDLTNVGWIDISQVNYKDKTIQQFVKVWIPKIGLPQTKSIFPGYYLFKNSNLVAYHPGTIDVSKIDPRIQGAAAIVGAIFGLIIGIVEKDVTKGFQTFYDAMEAPVGLKVFQFFKEILEGGGSAHSHQKQKVVYDEEVLKAYNLLRVSPEATDKEVTKAWKKMMLEFHPDKSQTDKEARTKFCAELNNAYDLVKKSRAKGKKK